MPGKYAYCLRLGISKRQHVITGSTNSKVVLPSLLGSSTSQIYLGPRPRHTLPSRGKPARSATRGGSVALTAIPSLRRAPQENLMF